MMQKKHAALAGMSVLGLAILGYAVISERSEAPRQVAAPLPSVAPARALAAPSAAASAVAAPVRTPEQILGESCSGALAQDCTCRKAAVLGAFERVAELASATELAKQSEATCAELVGLVAEGLARLGRVEEATAAARDALSRAPRSAYAAYAEALALYRSNRRDAAREAAQRATSFGRGATADVLLGMIEYEAKNFDEAARMFERAMKADPKNGDAVFNMGVLHQRRNEYRLAREAYLKALALNPSYHDARYNLAILTLGVGATSEARHHFEKLKSSAGPNDPRVSRLAERFGGPAGQVAPEMRLRTSPK
jgi:tetratricopeptide (TPR) repeat protein